MTEQLFTFAVNYLDQLQSAQKQSAIAALEAGKIIHFPNYAFSFTDAEKQLLLSEAILDGKHKNVSFDYLTQRLGGVNKKPANCNLANILQRCMHRYAEFAKEIITSVLHDYDQACIWGRTSYRPAEIKGRVSSKRKDDTRLHVDSFPSSPVNGLRILRVFSNVNPDKQPRVWNTGEPFNQVADKFVSKLPDYKPKWAKFLQLIKATKSLRSAYDHYQLQLHDHMKLDDHYQQTAAKQRVEFMPGSTWLVFTDQVSHAALSGQYLFEQTFYLPVAAMSTPELSPWHYWQQKKIAVTV